jgi:hypothetical protein
MSPYASDWVEFRRMRRIGIAFLVLCLFCGTLFLTLARTSFASWSWLPQDLSGALGLAWMYCAVRLEFFRCPRCRERFFFRVTLMDRLPGSRTCKHCQLRLFE